MPEFFFKLFFSLYINGITIELKMLGKKENIENIF